MNDRGCGAQLVNKNAGSLVAQQQVDGFIRLQKVVVNQAHGQGGGGAELPRERHGQGAALSLVVGIGACAQGSAARGGVVNGHCVGRDGALPLQGHREGQVLVPAFHCCAAGGEEHKASGGGVRGGAVVVFNGGNALGCGAQGGVGRL